MVDSGVTVGSARLEPLIHRLGLGEPDGPILGVVGEPARKFRSRVSSASSFFAESLRNTLVASPSLSAFARRNASYRLPICDRYGLKAEGSTWGMLGRVTGGMSLVDGGL